MKTLLFFILFSSCALVMCSSPNKSSGNAPADHTISKDGIKHKTGLNTPQTSCVSCHGQDLRGGTSETSCYTCHGKEW
jgi:hypothetical protein